MQNPISNLRCLPWYKRHARQWTGIALLVSDLLAFGLLGSFLILAGGLPPQPVYLDVMHLLIVLTLAGFLLQGLYPGMGLSPVNELRAIVSIFTIACLSLAALSFLLPSMASLSPVYLIIDWLLGLVLLPIFRLATRYFLLHHLDWGEPILLLGGGTRVIQIYEHLRKRRMLGFNPLAVSTVDGTRPPILQDVSFDFESLLHDSLPLRQLGIRTVLLTTNALPYAKHLQGSIFERLIHIPDQENPVSLGILAHDLDGIFAYEVSQNLVFPYQQGFKRLVDLFLTIFGCLLFSPILLGCATFVKVSSPGPVFYKQTRIGKGGQRFKVWKFRTMVANADELLNTILRENSELRVEWQTTQKLKQDPRITIAGRFLRKFSLDELPQIFNVLLGEMSLVGPRPIVDEEIKNYGDDFELYIAVQPGITGLWQVSGRNDTTYAERVRLDVYYVRNWSLWLDIYILMKTFWVVIRGKGAY